LKKTGAGTLTLAVANTFSGDTSISGTGNGGPGQLALSNANALSNSVLDLDDGNRIAFVLPEATDYRLGGLKGGATNLVIGSNSLTLGKDDAINNKAAEFSVVQFSVLSRRQPFRAQIETSLSQN
jgi:autotransporter-associated beta strand protein